jgi:hypothetical protein
MNKMGKTFKRGKDRKAKRGKEKIWLDAYVSYLRNNMMENTNGYFLLPLCARKFGVHYIPLFFFAVD